MKLNQQQIDLLKLIKRSVPDAGGWYRVSKMLWPHMNGKLPEDLVEAKPSEDGEYGWLKFTERGQAVADYA